MMSPRQADDVSPAHTSSSVLKTKALRCVALRCMLCLLPHIDDHMHACMHAWVIGDVAAASRCVSSLAGQCAVEFVRAN